MPLTPKELAEIRARAEGMGEDELRLPPSREQVLALLAHISALEAELTRARELVTAGTMVIDHISPVDDCYADGWLDRANGWLRAWQNGGTP